MNEATMIDQYTQQDIETLMRIATRKSARDVHPVKTEIHVHQYEDVVEALKQLGWKSYLCGQDELYCKKEEQRAVIRLTTQP